MNFYTEKAGYEKTILSDLQGAWENLRSAIADNAGFEKWDRILFHVDEAMSWESVRDLQRMHSTFMVIRNIAAQTSIPGEVEHWIQAVSTIMNDALERIANGERL